MKIAQQAISLLRKATTLFSFSTIEGDKYERWRASRPGGIAYPLNDERAMTSAAVFGGIKIISEDVGSLSFVTRKRISEKESQPEFDHPLYGLLHDAPNPDMTAMEFREALTGHALLTGSGYAQIERSRADQRIIAFWPWMPYEVTRDRDRSGRPVFLHKSGNGPQKTYSQRDVFVLNGFGLTGQGGLSLLTYANRTLGLITTQEDYASRFFSQDQTPNLILEHPGKLGPSGVTGVKQAWAAQNEWHAPRVLQEGMKATQLHPDAEKSQLVEQRAFQLLEVCRFLRLSPHKLADMGRATWGNVEQLNINHYTETLRPWCERWEQAIKLRCLMEEPRIYVKHNIAGFLRGDFRTQTEGFGKLLEKGVYSINEVRALMDLNPIDGGDDHFIQLNMQDVTQAADAAAALAEADANSQPTKEQPSPWNQLLYSVSGDRGYLNGKGAVQ